MVRKNNANGGKGIKRIVPKRPPRPTTAYNLFVKDYVARHGHNANAFRNAAAAWRGLNARERQIYEERNQAEKRKRQKAIKKWSKINKAAKRPPSAYSLFVKSLWSQDKTAMQGLGFGVAARTASERWRDLPQVEKGRFEADHRELMKRYRAETQKVTGGGTLNLNWMDLTNEAPAAEDAEEENEDGEDMLEMEDDVPDPAEDAEDENEDDLEEDEDDLDLEDAEDDLEDDEDGEDLALEEGAED